MVTDSQGRGQYMITATPTRQISAHHLRPVGTDPVYPPPPEDREHNEDTSVGGVHASEGCRLELGHDAVEEQQEPVKRAQGPSPALLQPKPDKLAAADLHQAGED